MTSGVPARANYFKQPAKDIVFQPGGKHIQVPVKHHVTNVLTAGSPIIFELPHIDKACYNFAQTYIKFQLRIRTRPNGGAPDVVHVHPANGIAHTVWKNIDLTANGTPLTNSYQPYSHKKMIEHMLTSSTTNENSDRIWGYKKRVNVPGIAAINDLDRDTQRGQPHFVVDTPTITEEFREFIMYPNLDFFECDSNIVSLDTVKWVLKLTPHEPEHCLNWAVNYGADLAAPAPNAAAVAASLAHEFRVEIDPTTLMLYLKVEYMSDSAYVATIEAAKEGRGFVYNYTPTAIKTKTLVQGTQSVEYADFSPRNNPVLYAHTFVVHEGYVGNKRYNPYLFRPPPELARFYNYMNGQLLQEQAPVDLHNGAGLPHLYINNNNALGIEEYTQGLSFNHEEMARGFWFKIVSLVPSTDSMDLTPMLYSGSHTYRVELANNAARSYTILTYIRYEPSQVLISLDGTVTNNFSVS